MNKYIAIVAIAVVFTTLQHGVTSSPGESGDNQFDICTNCLTKASITTLIELAAQNDLDLKTVVILTVIIEKSLGDQKSGNDYTQLSDLSPDIFKKLIIGIFDKLEDSLADKLNIGHFRSLSADKFKDLFNGILNILGGGKMKSTIIGIVSQIKGSINKDTLKHLFGIIKTLKEAIRKSLNNLDPSKFKNPDQCRSLISGILQLLDGKGLKGIDFGLLRNLDPDLKSFLSSLLHDISKLIDYLLNVIRRIISPVLNVVSKITNALGFNLKQLLRFILGIVLDVLNLGGLILEVLKALPSGLFNDLIILIIQSITSFNGIDDVRLDDLKNADPDQLRNFILSIIQVQGLLGGNGGLSGIDFESAKALSPQATKATLIALRQLVGDKHLSENENFKQFINADPNGVKAQVLQMIQIISGGQDLGNLYDVSGDVIKAADILELELLARILFYDFDFTPLTLIEPDQFKAFTLFLAQGRGGTKTFQGYDPNLIYSIDPVNFKATVYIYLIDIAGRGVLRHIDLKKVESMDPDQFKSAVIALFTFLGGEIPRDIDIQNIKQIDPEQFKALIFFVLKALGHPKSTNINIGQFDEIEPDQIKSLIIAILEVRSHTIGDNDLKNIQNTDASQLKALLLGVLKVLGNTRVFKPIGSLIGILEAIEPEQFKSLITGILGALGKVEGLKELISGKLNNLKPELLKLLIPKIIQFLDSKILKGVHFGKLNKHPDLLKHVITFVLHILSKLTDSNVHIGKLKTIDLNDIKSIVHGLLHILSGKGLNGLLIGKILSIVPDQLKTLLVSVIQILSKLTDSNVDIGKLKTINPNSIKAIVQALLKLLSGKGLIGEKILKTLLTSGGKNVDDSDIEEINSVDPAALKALIVGTIKTVHDRGGIIKLLIAILNGIEPAKFKGLITTVFKFVGGKGLKELVSGKLKTQVLEKLIAKILSALLRKIGSISNGNGKLTKIPNTNENYITIHLGNLDDINADICKSVVIRALEHIGGQNGINGINLANLQCADSSKFKSFVIEILNGLRTNKHSKIYLTKVKSTNPETFKNLVIQILEKSAGTDGSSGICLEELKCQDASIFKNFIIYTLEPGLYQKTSQQCD